MTVAQGLEAEQQNSPKDGGADEGQLGEDEKVDEWGEPTHKYDADPKTTTGRVIRQTGHVDLFGTVRAAKEEQVVLVQAPSRAVIIDLFFVDVLDFYVHKDLFIYAYLLLRLQMYRKNTFHLGF